MSIFDVDDRFKLMSTSEREPPTKPDRLSDWELAFQNAPENWMGGPTFDLRFHCNSGLDFETFSSGLSTDPMAVHDERFHRKAQVLLWDQGWRSVLGAYHYDFDRPGRREPSIVFYPGQYDLVMGAAGLESSSDSGVAEQENLGRFLVPLVGLARRMKHHVGAKEVLLFFEDDYPSTALEGGLLVSNAVASCLVHMREVLQRADHP